MNIDTHTVVIHFSTKFLYDGPAMVSTGVDSRDGNTVGDDCKSSKFSKCKSIYIRVLQSTFHCFSNER
jgi:hypothetical protein